MSKIGINVLCDLICLKFLYPNEIYNLLLLSKDFYHSMIQYNDTSRFLSNLSNFSGVIQYWISLRDNINFYKQLEQKKKHKFSRCFPFFFCLQTTFLHSFTRTDLEIDVEVFDSLCPRTQTQVHIKRKQQ